MSDLYQSGIRPVIDDYLKKKSEEERDYGEYFSASSAGYCPRLVIMRRLGVPKVPELADSAAQTRIFEAGHIFHSWMQRITKNSGLSIAQEVELKDEELKIIGHFDDLVLINHMLPEEKEFFKNRPEENLVVKAHTRAVLYDYKTAHSASFNYSINRPMGHYHRLQLATYMYMLRNKPKGQFEKLGESLGYDSQIRNLTEARIMSISKDDLRLDEKQLMWSPELEKEVYQYWSTLNGYWRAYLEKGVLPNCTCADFDGGWLARRSAKGKIYCDYYYGDECCSERWFAIAKEKGLIKNDA